ncbi:MAG: Y4yA family PLP-dependent enzyme [Patescibacteria group bacterium]
MGNFAPPLTPIISDWMQSLISNKGLLYDMIAKYGSPLHINNSTKLIDNLRAFQKVMDKYGLNSKIFFARKPNHCTTFVKTAINNGFGIDTASYQELKESLDFGGKNNIVFSAAIKENAAIELAIRHNVTIILDNFDELEQIINISTRFNKTAQIGVRFTGFTNKNGQKTNSRFGFPIADSEQVLQKLSTYNNIILEGFHFHLGSYVAIDRSIAIYELLTVIKRAREMGHKKCNFIDIGGGFLVNYLVSKKEWEEFHEKLKSAILGSTPPITFMNQPLHIHNINGEAKQVGSIYPYYSEKSKEQILDDVLSYEINGQSIAKYLISENIELRIEPGRSSLDQCGITVAEVVYTKKDSQGQNIVGLNMNFTQLLSSSVEFGVDPVIIYKDHDSVDESEPTGVVFVGTYCMDRDTILKRIIRVGKLPKRGDLIVFINTAGYMSHFLATNSHLFNPPKNIFFNEKTNQFSLDSYNSN